MALEGRLLSRRVILEVEGVCPGWHEGRGTGVRVQEGLIRLWRRRQPDDRRQRAKADVLKG